jgi:hypothetical protein
MTKLLTTTTGRLLASTVAGNRKLISVRPDDNEYALVLSTGQYINTEFSPSNTSRVVLDFQYTSVTQANTPLFGARTTGTTGQFANWYRTGATANNGRDDYGTLQTNMPTGAMPANTRLVYDKNRNVTSVNGTVHLTHTASTFTTTPNMLLFALGDGNLTPPVNTGVGTWTARLYRCQVWDNDVLVRDLIPVHIGSSRYGTPAPSNCLWCTVQRRYYENSGTGSLGIERVETGLVSTGTQRINTGIAIGNVDFEISTRASVQTGQTANAVLIGNSNRIYIAFRSGTNILYWTGRSGALDSTFATTGGTHDFRLIPGQIFVDGVSRGTAALTEDINNIIWIFSSDTGHQIRGTIFSARIIRDGILVRDFVPVRQGSTRFASRNLFNGNLMPAPVYGINTHTSGGQMTGTLGAQVYIWPCKPNTTYSARRVTPTTGRFWMGFTQSPPAQNIVIFNNENTNTTWAATNQDVTITATSQSNSTWGVLYFNAASSAGTIPDVMLNEGSTLLPWEPFIGPAPSNCLFDRVTRTYFQNAGTGTFNIAEALIGTTGMMSLTEPLSTDTGEEPDQITDNTEGLDE